MVGIVVIWGIKFCSVFVDIVIIFRVVVVGGGISMVSVGVIWIE